MLITPTGIAPDRLLPEQIVHMGLTGEVAPDQLTPSSEWQMHADVYAAKPEAAAVVHCHSPYATMLACARKSIPAMHYMVAAAGGHGIPLADYATFGGKALSEANLSALASTRARWQQTGPVGQGDLQVSTAEQSKPLKLSVVMGTFGQS